MTTEHQDCGESREASRSHSIAPLAGLYTRNDLLPLIAMQRAGSADDPAVEERA